MASGSFRILFDARDFARVAKQVKLGTKRVREYVDVRVKLMALSMQRNVMAATPKRTSALAGSTKAIQEAESRWRIVQTATAKKRWRPGYLYGRGLRLGTRAHDIAPPHPFKRNLFWTGITGGRPVALVHHPGARDPYHRDALVRSKSIIRATSRSIAAEGALRYVGKKS